MSAELLSDLARVKAIFQQRAICAAMGIDPDAPARLVDGRRVELLRHIPCDDRGHPVAPVPPAGRG